MSSLEKLKSVASDKILLYIESNQTLQKNFGIYLQKTFKNFYQAYDGEEGFELFLKVKPNFVIMDLDLSKKNSIELLADMKEIDENIQILTLSASNENYTLLQSLDMGLAGMLLKPVNFAQLADKLIGVIPPTKRTIIPQMEKRKISAAPIAPKVKPAPTPTKVLVKKLQEQAEEKIIEKKTAPIEEKVTINVESKVEPKLVINIPKTCMEEIQDLAKREEKLIIINTYKGINIQNKGEFLHCTDSSFELQTTVAQIVAANYEKHVILKIANKNKYIFANIINIDLKNNRLQLIKPKYINYQQRDTSVLRLTADKSFKATMFFDKTHIDFKAKQISSKYVLLITDALELDVKSNMQLDLTLGFDIDSPSSLIKDKKFTKTFAKGTVLRVDKTSSGLQIAMEIEVQKSGQSNYLKYLKQREQETIEELKKIIKR